MAADVVKVVDTGLAIVTNRLKNGDTGATEPKYIQWGTGTTAAADGNTALQTARAEARTSAVTSQQTTNTANDTYRAVGTITCATTAAAITEYGQFDAAAAGNMLVRATFDVMNLQVGDSIQFTSNVVFNQG